MAFDLSTDRWYPLKDHEVVTADGGQRRIVMASSIYESPARFVIIPGGRRSGKSERAKRHLVRQALAVPGMYFAAAPTRAQAKTIFWQDLKELCWISQLQIAGIDCVREGDLTLMLPNGSQIVVLGLDAAARIEGVPWSGGLIDEIADTHADVWPLHVRPALDTQDPRRPGYKPWCWLIGVPEGLNHYYDMCEYARTSGDPEWQYYHWLSTAVLSDDAVAAARRTLSARQFRQEYEASFEGAAGRIYEDYGDHNVTTETIKPDEPLMWMHDFNFTPLSSAIAVLRNGNVLNILDEIILSSAVASQSAIEFIERYRDHENKTVQIYGDPAGQAGEKHGQVSNYTAIEGLLRQAGWKVERRVRAAAPSIRDRQNAVRAKIKTAEGHTTLFVNAGRCRYTHKGLATVSVKEGSTFLEDDRDEFQHITTAVGYCVDREWPVSRVETVAKVTPLPNASAWRR